MQIKSIKTINLLIINLRIYCMDVFEAIRTRRTIRKYKDKSIPFDDIVTIMQAGKYAPS